MATVELDRSSSLDSVPDEEWAIAQMDQWVSCWSELTSSIAEHGLLTLAILVMVKSAGVPLLGPADLLIVKVGADARDGRRSVVARLAAVVRRHDHRRQCVVRIRSPVGSRRRCPLRSLRWVDA